MLPLKRIVISILVSVCALTTFVAAPASADNFAYNCDSNSWGWYNGYWEGNVGPSFQVPFNLSTGEAEASMVYLHANGNVLTNGTMSLHGADTHYYPANYYYYYVYHYRSVVIQYGSTANTLCVSWIYNTYWSGQQRTTLRLARGSGGTVFGSVEGFWNHDTGGSYPSANGQRFDSNFVISNGRFYPYSAVPASVDSGSADANSVTLGYTLHSDNQDNPVTDYALQFRKVDGVWQDYVHDPAVDGSATVTGLEYLTNYEFRVASVTNSGLGPWSDLYSISTTSRPASAPTITDFLTGNGSVSLDIAHPSIIGDVALLDYEYSFDDGLLWNSSGSVNGHLEFSGLTNGMESKVRVRAVNSAGPGEVSDAVSVISTDQLPAAPSIGSFSVADESATINIDQATGITAKSITGYQYNINNGTAWKTCPVLNGSCTINKLINGVRSYIKVRASNANGFSSPSNMVLAVSRTIPQAPKITQAKVGIRSLAISYLAPADNGGDKPKSYEYSLDGGETWVAPVGSSIKGPIKVSGLANATEYQVALRALNSAGPGVVSTIVQAKTPAVVPSAPVIRNILADKNQLSVNFTIPSDDGGATITNYMYSIDGITWKVLAEPSTATQIVIPDLLASRSYSIKIKAINAAGNGKASSSQSAKTLR